MFRTVIEDVSMTPCQLYDAAFAGELVYAPAVGILVPARLRKIGDQFVMTGITGRHSISADPHNTSASRLHTHWQGFKEIAKAKAVQEGY